MVLLDKALLPKTVFETKLPPPLPILTSLINLSTPPNSCRDTLFTIPLTVLDTGLKLSVVLILTLPLPSIVVLPLTPPDKLIVLAVVHLAALPVVF